jgi:hypothetical protein
MTEEMLTTSRRTSAHFGVDRVEFREGLAEALPLPDCRLVSSMCRWAREVGHVRRRPWGGQPRAYQVYGYPFLARAPASPGSPAPRAGRGGRGGDR